MPFDRRLPRTLRLLPLIAGLAATGIARADDPNPYYIGVSQTVAHESNIYLTPDGVPSTSAMHYTTALIGGLDQSIGRERLFGNVSLRHNAYSGSASDGTSNSELNNNGYGATLGLDWATIDRISGNFTYRGNRTLAQLNSDVGAAQQSQVRQNIGTTQEFDATARVGVVTRLTGIFGYTYQKLSYSDPLYNYREFHQDTVQAGLNYSSSSALIFGSALRYTRGQFPQTTDPTTRLIGPDDFHRNDLDLTAQWIPSGASTLNARVSFSREEHDLSQQRSFSGATGNVSWDWRPTGKLEFITTVSRDTGQQSTFFGQIQNNPSQTVTGDISRVTNALQLEAKYALTSKVSFDAVVSTNQRSLVDNISNNAGPNLSGHDRLTAASLGARWTPTRSIEVGCNLSNERRTSDIVVLSLPYSSNSVGCYGQLTLQ